MKLTAEDRQRVAQTYAFFAFVCGSSSFSSSGINRYVGIFILRTAEEFVSEPNASARPAALRSQMTLSSGDELDSRAPAFVNDNVLRIVV
jgi:hypothetical protein